MQAACKSVCDTLATDPHIAEKLVESNRNLEWIKACKDQQGSVEQSSLTLVSKINESGVFQARGFSILSVFLIVYRNYPSPAPF
jgi:hypothetical protein